MPVDWRHLAFCDQVSPFWRKPARDEPSLINTARFRWGPENLFCRTSTLGQRRRLIA